MNCLRSLGRWDRGFESHSNRVCLVYVCVYSVFVLSCVYVEALRRADHSSKESYRLWRTITGLNKRPGPWMGWKSNWKEKESAALNVVHRLQPTSQAGSSLADFSTLKMEAICSSETSIHTRSTRCHIPEDGILYLSLFTFSALLLPC
jgi:hypothetical protein